MAGKLAGAVFSPEDHQVDNRKLATALAVAARAAGARIHEHAPIQPRSRARAGASDGIVLADGRKHAADVVVLAAGAWSRGIARASPIWRRNRCPPVRPIKGQMLALRMDKAAPLVPPRDLGPGIYLVPRLDGRLIVGATVEEKGFDSTP